MTADVIRRRHMKTFMGLSKYSRLTGWLVVAAYVAQVLAAVALGHWLLSSDVSAPVVAGCIVLVLFVGTRLRGLNNIVHECSHSTFTANRADNVRLGSICASIGMGCFQDYRDEHLSHHAHLGDYEQDMDLKRIEALGLHEPLTRRVLMRHLLTPLIGRHVPYYVRISLSRRDGWVYLALKLAILAGVALFTALFPLTGALFLIVPFVFVYSALNYWADCLDHAGLTAAEDDLDASRNIAAPAAIRLLFFPRNDSFHLVHHLFPQIPARHLPASHRVLAQDGLYRSKTNAVRPSGSEAPLPVPVEEVSYQEASASS